MSRNPWRDCYLAIEADTNGQRRDASQTEINAAVFLARACVVGGFVLATVLGGVVYAWVR